MRFRLRRGARIQVLRGQAMHWGIRIVACVTAVAALGLVCISAAMNFRFGYSFGRTELDGWLYGGASALSDVLKAAIPFVVVCALKRRRWGQAASGAMVWVICVVFSFSSATGFGIANRSFTSDATILQAGLNRNELTALQSDQQELTHIRATLGSANLRATDRRDLELRETALSRETGELRSRLALAPTVLTPTTQAEALAHLFGAEPSRVTNGLVILLASLLELGSGLGMFVALGTFANPPSGKIHSKRTLGPLSSPLRRGERRMAKPRAGNVVPLTREVTPLIASFLNLQTRRSEGSWSEASELYETLVAYCHARKVGVPSQRRFGEELAERGYLKDRRAKGGRVRYLGIELLKMQAAAA